MLSGGIRCEHDVDVFHIVGLRSSVSHGDGTKRDPCQWPLKEYIAPVLDRAGSGGWADMRLVAPPLGAVAFMMKTLGRGPVKAVPSCSPLSRDR